MVTPAPLLQLLSGDTVVEGTLTVSIAYQMLSEWETQKKYPLSFLHCPNMSNRGPHLQPKRHRT